MTNLVEMIAKALVDKPQDVQVSESTGDTGMLITLQVSKDDMGKVIGKQGRIARRLFARWSKLPLLKATLRLRLISFQSRRAKLLRQ